MVILIYHDIVKEKFPKGIYPLSKDNFLLQMEYLKTNNYRVFSLSELARRLDDHAQIPEKSVIITFDDGLASHFELAYPILKQFSFPACFFIISGLVGRKGYMNWGQIRAMHADSLEIGSHGLTHRILDLLPEEDILFELKESKALLEKNLGIPINFFSLPRGTLREKEITQLCRQAGYRVLCLSRIGYINAHSKAFFLKRFPLKKCRSLKDFTSVITGSSLKLFSTKVDAFLKDSLKRYCGVANYEYLRKKFLREEYVNEPPFLEE